MGELRNAFKRFVWGLVIGFALYLVTVFFWIQGNPLILDAGNFTYVGMITFIAVAIADFSMNLIGLWPKEKAKTGDKQC